MGWSVFFFCDRLLRILSYQEADIETKQPRGVCEARCDALQCSLRMGVKGSVVREEKVPDHALLGRADGLEAP